MVPTRRTRKPAATIAKDSDLIPQQRGIRSFGKVSKAQVYRTNRGKSKAVQVQQLPGSDRELVDRGAKRKRESNSQVSDLEDCKELPKPIAKPEASQPSLPAIAPGKRIKTHQPITETPTKGARAILESFCLQPSSPSSRSSSPPQFHADTPPTSPSCSRSPVPRLQGSDELPEELQDLIDLYASFLTALSLHYAHHGSLAPVDLRVLCPSVARTWRRRVVSVQDVRQILAIAQQGSTPEVVVLSLSDYGHGKVCVEAADIQVNRGLHKKLINEEALNEIFRQNLEQQWASYISSGSPSRSAETFVPNLPLLPVGTCTSLFKLTPLLSKGQRRLEDLKAGAIKAQKASSLSAPSANDQTSRPKLTTSRSDSLLSRIRAKEMVQSTLPPPPSAAMLERKSSLNRLEEIVPVFELLTSGTIDRIQQSRRPLGNPQLQTQTQSFTMPTLIQHLQMSLRNPISKDDAIRCVRLLAKLVPEWVGVREVGKCVGVTVRRGSAAGRDEIDRRVQCMLDKL